jgi:hypothetical protein
MRSKLLVVTLAVLAVSVPVFAQSAWIWSYRLEVRADYRWSEDESHPVAAPFPPDFIPEGQSRVLLQTVEPGSNFEFNTSELQLDLGYGDWFAARAKVHAGGLHRRNPTSDDRKFDADELWVRVGPKPEMLERPAGTSLFFQAGKAPRMERQPVRLLESYGLAANSFNRFEDMQATLGGTVGRNFYWRVQAANGNPLFFRDANALAGDNGTDDRRPPNPNPKLKSGFPILYNAETEDLVFSSDHVQWGSALGYRWQREDQTLGFDAIVFGYRRDLAEAEELTGTFYEGDLALLRGAFGISLPITSNEKTEYGARVYAEWHDLTAIAQFTKQNVAGLQREGWELEAGYRFPLNFGPFEYIQPAVRYSGLDNRFIGPATFVAPSVRWDWAKYDAGIRVGLKRGFDVTAEYTKHHVGSRFHLNLREALVTVRWRM